MIRIVVVLAAALIVGASGNMGKIDVDGLLKDARSDVNQKVLRPSMARTIVERAFFELAFRTAARADAAHFMSGLEKLAGIAGYRLITGEDRVDGSPVALILERPDARRGAGEWLLRLGPARSEAFVQAPHTFSDLGSAPMALELWRALGARALAMSTAHRRENDVAHDENSTFQTATLAWLAGAGPSGSSALLVQIHSFADASADADVVLSSGDESNPPDWLNSVKVALSAALPGARVASYPADVDVLGATTNAQGRAVRSQGARFLHIELGASLRGEVGESKRNRRELATAIAKAAVPELP